LLRKVTLTNEKFEKDISTSFRALLDYKIDKDEFRKFVIQKIKNK